MFSLGVVVFVVAIIVAILIHEAGHLLVAKIFGDLKGRMWRIDTTDLRLLSGAPTDRWSNKIDLNVGTGKPFLLFEAPQFGLVTKTLRWRRSLFEPLTQWVNTLLVVALILMFKGQTVAEGKLHAALAIMAALPAAAQAVLLFLAIRSPAQIKLQVSPRRSTASLSRGAFRMTASLTSSKVLKTNNPSASPIR